MIAIKDLLKSSTLAYHFQFDLNRSKRFKSTEFYEDTCLHQFFILCDQFATFYDFFHQLVPFFHQFVTFLYQFVTFCDFFHKFVSFYTSLRFFGIFFHEFVSFSYQFLTFLYKFVTFFTSLSLFVTFFTTSTDKIFEKNSSFQVKQHTTRKVQFLFSRCLLLVLTKFSF